MEEIDSRILVDAKEEYSKELIRVLKRYILEGIQSLYDQSCEICKKNKSKIILTFQDLLEQIPKWNQELIEKETNRIIENSKCEFFEDLITAVFVSHTKILAAIRTNTKREKRINLTIPKPDTFIHKCYIEVAREFWKSPCLLHSNINTYERMRNQKYSEEVISHCIQETIRKLLPLKYILKESLGDSYQDDQSSDSEDITKSISKSEESNLKKLVQNEIKNHYSTKSIIDEDTLFSLDDVADKPKDTNKTEIDLGLDKKEKQEDQLKLDKDLEKVEEPKIVPEPELKIDMNDTKDIKIQSGGSLFSANKGMDASVSKINTLDSNTDLPFNIDQPISQSINTNNVSLADNNNSKKELNLSPIINTDSEPNEINLDSLKISDDTLPVDNSISLSQNSGGDLNELDIGSLVKNNSVVKLDGDYNMVDTNNLYSNLNKESTIKSDVISDLNTNLRNDSSPNLFDDAPLTD